MSNARILVVDDEADNRTGGGARVRVELPIDETARGQAMRREARRPEPRRERA